MGLFSKSKETNDLRQTQEIKDISNELTSPLNLPNQNQANTQTTNFNNPFSQNQTPNSMQVQPQPEMNSTIQPTQNIMPDSLPDLNLNQNSMQPQTNPPINDLTNQSQTMEQIIPSTQNSIFNSNPSQELNSQLPSENSNQFTQLNQSQQTTTQPISTQTQNQYDMPEQKKEFTKDQIQELVDETVEQVIEERWQQVIQKIEKVAQWKDKQEQHINLIKDDILTMKESFEKLEKRIITKVSDYDRNILDVNSEIKALEKVFQKITPTLVNNVNELSNIAKAFKADSKTEHIN